MIFVHHRLVGTHLDGEEETLSLQIDLPPRTAVSLGMCAALLAMSAPVAVNGDAGGAQIVRAALRGERRTTNPRKKRRRRRR